MTTERVPTRSRWTYLTVVCVGVLSLLAGCVGDNVREKAPLEVERPTGSSQACTEVDVLRETQGFEPELLPIGDHGATWPIDLREGEAVKIEILWGGSRGGGTGMGLPDLRMAEPGGSLLLEKTAYSINDHTVSIETNGTHEITVEHTSLTKSARWIVEIHWYPDIECA